MEESITKQKDQTIWYENDELIREYLESSENLAKLKTASPQKELSLLKLIRESLASPTE